MVRSRVRLLARLTGANIRRHRARWVLTTFGVAIGVASFTGVLAISGSIMTSFEQSVVRTAGRAQLQVSNGTPGLDAALIDEIGAVPGVEVASGTVQYSVIVPALGRRLTVFGVLFGADHSYRTAQFGGELLELPDAATFLYEVDSVAVPPALLQEQGWTLGSTIEVVGPKGPRALVVRGTLRDTGALRVFGGDVAVMDADGAQHAFGQLDRFHWVDVVVRSDADVEMVRAALTTVVAGRAVVDTPFGRGRRMETMLGTLRWMLTMSGVVAMLVGVFLIQHTVATAIRQRRPDLTRLRELGARRALIVVYLLAEAFGVGILGSALGVAMGVGFAVLTSGMFGDAIATMYAPVPAPRLALTWTEYLAAFGLGVGTVLVAALVPTWTLSGSRPRFTPGTAAGPARMAILGLAALASGLACAVVAGALPFAPGIVAIGAFAGLTFLGTTCLVPTGLRALAPVLQPVLRRSWGVLGTWAWKQIGKHPLHTATTVGALAAGVTFSLGMATVLGSYRTAFASWFDQTFSADIFVNAGSNVSLLAGPTLDGDLVRELADVDGVARVMPWRLLEVELDGRPIIVQGMAETLIDHAHPGLSLRHDEGEVVISDSLAERFDLDVGDELVVPATIAPLRLKIRGVAPDYALDLGNVKVGWTLFSRSFATRDANLVAIDAAPGSSSRDLKHRIEERTMGRYDVMVLTGGELRTIVDELIDQSFALTYALQMLAVLVTVLAMVNATSASILDRSGDLAMWHALGLERRRLVGLLVTEAGVLGLLAGLLGLAAGALVGATLIRIVAPAVVGFRLPLIWSPSTWAMLLLAVIGAATLSAWFVVRDQARQSVPSAGAAA